MHFVIWEGQDKLADFIRQHYGTLKREEAASIEKQLIAANPELGNPAALPIGAVLRLPGTPRQSAAGLAPAMAQVVPDLLEQLERFAAQLEADLASEAAALADDRRRLGSDTVKRCVEQAEEAARMLDGVRRAMQQRQAFLDNTADFAKLLPAMRAALERMSA